MKEKILSYFLKIDIYGTIPQFTINGEKQFNTYLGSIMTLISALIITLFFIMYSYDVIMHLNPKLITTIYNEPKPLKRILTNSDFVMTLSLQHYNYSNFIDEKIYNIKAGLHTFYNEGDGKIIETKTELEVIKCSEYNFEIIPYYFSTLDLHNLYCLKNSTWYFEGEYKSEYFSYLSFKFSKCKNSTKNNYKCESNETIESILRGGYIGIFMSDKVVIPNNFSIPHRTYGKNIYSTFSVKHHLDYWIYFKPVEVHTDSGLFFKRTKEDYFISYDKELSYVDFRESEEFAVVILRESPIREVYERSYTKIQEVAANTGGIVKIITLCSNFIVYFFRQMLYKNFMIQFFRFNKKEDNKIQHNKIMENSSLKIIQGRNNYNKGFFEPVDNKNNKKNYATDDTPKFQTESINNNNETIIFNNNNKYNIYNNNSLNINNLNYNSNSNNNLLNNILPNPNILLNNNNKNNLSHSNNIKANFSTYSRTSMNNNRFKKRDSCFSVISDLNSIINTKQIEERIRRVKPSRNCFNIIFKKNCIKKIKIININFSKIDFLFDIVQYFKTIIEVKLIRNKVFDEDQKEKLSHLFKFNYEFDADKEGYDIFYKKKEFSTYSYKIN